MATRLVRAALASGWLAFAAFGTHDARAGTARRDPPLLFGAGAHVIRPPIEIDPSLPTGSDLVLQHERPHSGEAGCSLRLPVCVHRGPLVNEVQAARALTALETAYERVALALGLPAPLGDEGQGGSDALDWYLNGDAELSTESAAIRLGGLDRSAAFCLGGNSDDERDATRCVADAVARRLDAGETSAVRRSFATELWWLTGLPSSLDVEAIDDAQAHPERALAARSSDFSSAGALLFDFMESSRSSQSIGALSASLFSAAASRTAPGAWQWNNEPDVFEVLRHSLDEDTGKMATLLGEYAVSRAFLGDRDDGVHPPGLEWAGRFARPRYDWVIAFSSLPRRVRASRPIEPTGIQMIYVDLDEVPLGVSLGFESEWEAPISFKWRLISLDDKGQEMARVDVPFQERGRSAEGRVVNLLGVRAVLAIGINMGGVDLAHPFDPDQDPFEAQSCTAYFARM